MVPYTSASLRAAIGLAAGVLVVSPFLTWEGDASAWDTTPAVALLALMTGLIALGAAATGGAVGLFRPDVSMRGAADMLGVATGIVLGYLVLFDLPSPEAGAFVALGSAWAVAFTCADWRVLKGAPAFPAMQQDTANRNPKAR